MATEYELKFKADPEILAAIDAAFPGANVMEMETAYFDTPTGAISARQYTLRQRLENGVSVCTLKVPDGDARGEWEVECEDIKTAIPKLIAMGASTDLTELVKEGIVHICGAKFTRLAKAVVLPECTVEIALDKGILLGGRKTEPLCEAEVELKEGTKAACDAFAKELAERFGLVAEEKSKFARALKLYKGE